MLAFRPLLASALAALVIVTTPALAADVAFGKSRQDSNLPVEVEADNLSVSQEDGTATFTGNVVITQGEMILSATEVLVVYAETNKKITRLLATGGVTMVSGVDAAEAASADYSIDAGTVLLKGNVLLTQGKNVMTGDQMTINLDTGTAQIGGRVKTTLQSGD
ncbi:lipopolysaccharide transport periplasmic protein LptA [Thalassovita taeanensis]|uniref:Lipopolysaccharide export system protein LptA n=1 Tax=Thalassovita taeanensis TaxID=657014 RepID=A0A1H9BV92_9RHOB|nr:lipopolysaccharide transport periplasmic protein LptA [Thalassovita taeanensis]SEP92789.1 lipopolysaccharide export system protein LptA [Thalassovita taeanensis]